MRTRRWTIPRCWKQWDNKPIFAGSAHHWDLYVATGTISGTPTVYGVCKGTRKGSYYEGWQNDGYVRAARPDPELIAKISAMRMMI